MSDSLWPHELQHRNRLLFPSPSPGACSNSCPLSQWFHPTISSSVSPFSSCPQSLPASVFSYESVLCIRWPKYWNFSFSINPSNEYSGLISFRIDWFDLLAFQGAFESLLQHHNLKASVLGAQHCYLIYLVWLLTTTTKKKLHSMLKSQKKQSEEARQASESDLDMAQMLILWNREFEISWWIC